MPTAIDQAEVAQFLFYEGELLDEYRLEEWLELFTEDGVFWIPLDPNADPTQSPSILFDDRNMRESRVHQLLHEAHWSQMPRSRIIHSITNVRAENQPNGKLLVRCNLLLTEFRSGGHRTLQYGLGNQRTFAARSVYHLVRTETSWLIALKKVMLINHDQAIENLTFII
jgi:3-phenylpropionate/cinnamic acid dioxygenase small subunit